MKIKNHKIVVTAHKSDNNIKKNLHTVWVGGPIPEIVKSYLNVWRDVNPDYNHITWIDTDNKFIALYNNAVKELREYGLKQYLVGYPNAPASEYYDQAVNFERGIRENSAWPHDNDLERITTIKKIAALLGDNKAEEYQAKIYTIENSFVEMTSNQQNYYQPISELFEKFSEVDNLRATALIDIYKKEINDRGNLAAASDILRLVALQTNGGIYIDTDLLPLIDWKLLNETGDFPAEENIKPEDIYSKKVYLEIEKYKGFPESKTKYIRSGLLQSQIDKIQELTKGSQPFERLSELSADHFYSDNSNMGWTNAELACDKNNNFTNALMDRIILNYKVLDKFNKLYSGKYDFAEVDDIATQLLYEFKLNADYENLFIHRLANYYRDSIVPESAQATATLFLTGPTMLDAVIRDTEAVGNNIIENKGTASLYTIEETFSSWAISQFGPDAALYLDKLKFGIELNLEEKEKLRNECFDLIKEKKEQATHLPDIAINFLKDFNTFSDSQLNLLIQAYDFSDSYIYLAKHAATQLGIENWSYPVTTSTASTEDSTGNSFNYEKQLIIQLQGDETSFLSAQALFGKHPKQSEWLQCRDGKINDIFTWSQDINSYQNITTPLVLNEPGAVRITLVGHSDHTVEGVTHFAGMNADQLRGMLESVFDKIGTHSTQFNAIQLNLTGCSLLNSSLSLEDTLPGQLALWMKDKADTLGLGREKFSVAAYEYPLRLVENGKKEIFFNSKWINKEVAAIDGMLNKTVLGWDDVSMQLMKRPLTLHDITNAATAIDSTMVAYKQLGKESQQQLLELHEKTTQELREALYQQKRPPEHGIEIEQKVIQALNLTNLSQEWNSAAQELHINNSLDEHWRASFTTRPLGEGYEVLFIHDTTGEKKWISTHEDIFQTFGEQYQVLSAQLGSTLFFDPHSGSVVAKPNVMDAEAVHTLNAAFLLQALMGQRPDLQGPSDALSWPMQLQNYVGIIQPGIGLGEDALHLGELINSAVSSEFKPLSSALSALHAVKPTLGAIVPALPGLLLDATNLTGIIAQLANSDDPTEIAVATTNLAMAGLTTGINVGALVTSFIPAAAGASAVLGIVAVPLAGIAAGLPALVEGFSKIAQSCEAAFKEFDYVYEGIKDPTQLQNLTPQETVHPLLSLGTGAVVSVIDFQQDSVTYGNVTMIGTDPDSGSGHTRVGNFDSFFSAPILDKNIILDVYQGLVLEHKQQRVDFSKAKLFYLPSGINKHYSFVYDSYSFHRGAKAPALRKLSAYYGRKFLWHFNAFVSDYAVSYLQTTLSKTPVQVQLDEVERTLIIPTITDENARHQLSYHFAGAGGKCTLILPSQVVSVEIDSSNSVDEHWSIDIEYVLKSSSIHDGNVILGAVQPQILQGMSISRTEITLGAQTVKFTSSPPEQVLLTSKLTVANIDEQVSLAISVNLVTGKKQHILVGHQSSKQPLQMATLIALANSLQLSGVVPLSINGQQGQLDVHSGIAAWVEDIEKNIFRFSSGIVSSLVILPGTIQILSNEKHILLVGSINTQQSITKFIARPMYQDDSFRYVLQQLYIDDTSAVNALVPLLDKTCSVNQLKIWIDNYIPQLSNLISLQLSSGMILSIKNLDDKQFDFFYHNETSTTGSFILNSANWLINNCTVEYSLNFGPPMLIVNANNIPQITFSSTDLECLWCNVKTELIINITHPSTSLTMPIQASHYPTVFIQAPENGQLNLTLNDIDFVKERFQQVGADLVMQYGKSSIIRVANAINPTMKLFMNFTNRQKVTVNDIILDAVVDSSNVINKVTQYFKLEDVISAVQRDDGIISFTGASGLLYEMRPFYVPEKIPHQFVIVGYKGNAPVVFPKTEIYAGIRSVIKIVNNQPIFNQKTELPLYRHAQQGPIYCLNEMLKFSDFYINYLIDIQYLYKLSDGHINGSSMHPAEYLLDISDLYSTQQKSLDLIVNFESEHSQEVELSKWLVSLGQAVIESNYNAKIIAKEVSRVLIKAMIFSSGQRPTMSWDY